MATIYYYVEQADRYRIKSTELIDELVTLLYDETADFITEGQRLELKLEPDYLDSVRIAISANRSRVPLYDIYSNHIFLICWDNVYERISINNYRFVDEHFYTDLTALTEPTDNDRANQRFLSYYNFAELEQTYVRIFYRSFVMNSYITHCRRPSFASQLTHIAPYYNMNELNFLAYDWDLTKKITVDPLELEHLCNKIKQYDISASVLIAHQLYIFNTKSIGLVKHYSLYGSYYMNQYLRKTLCCIDIDANASSQDDIIRNPYLEQQILIMIDRVKNAPAFARNHTVYRFVSTDEYLRHLKIGDVYQDPSFTSTTRNPFYYKEKYSFGYVLIKIRLPADIPGVGLCIESYSNFPNEEEIILPPTSRYRLDAVTDTVTNTQFHSDLKLQVHKKYEFTWIGDDYGHTKDTVKAKGAIKTKNIRAKDTRTKDIRARSTANTKDTRARSTANTKDTRARGTTKAKALPPILKLEGAYIPKTKSISLQDIIDDDNYRYISIADRLLYFRDNYTNMNSQFETEVMGHTITFSMESYNSMTVYKPFFYYETADGIMITTANPTYGNISLLIEIGYEIHVNYYFLYSVTDPAAVIDLDKPEWIGWLAALAYAVGSRSVVIHPNYILQASDSDSIEQLIRKTRHTFSQNIHAYMKNGTKGFQYTEVTPLFDYFQLDYLKGISLSTIVSASDKNELHRIALTSGTTNAFDFYLYIVEAYPQWIKILEQQLGRLYEPETNPFTNESYRLDAWQYLYDRNMVKQIPSDREFIVKPGSYKRLIGDKAVPQFKNRLRALALQTKAHVP